MAGAAQPERLFITKRPPTRTSSAAFTSKTRNRPRAFCSLAESLNYFGARRHPRSNPGRRHRRGRRRRHRHGLLRHARRLPFSAQTFTSLTAHIREQAEVYEEPTISLLENWKMRFRIESNAAAASTPRASGKRPGYTTITSPSRPRPAGRPHPHSDLKVKQHIYFRQDYAHGSDCWANSQATPSPEAKQRARRTPRRRDYAHRRPKTEPRR